MIHEEESWGLDPDPRAYNFPVEPSTQPHVELGQMFFSASEGHSIELIRRVYLFLRALGERVKEKVGDDPTYNTGVKYENQVFALRAYCWCDGEVEDHEVNCPSNFKCGDFEVSWYKNLGRGSSMSRNISADQLQIMAEKCFSSLSE